MSYPGNSSLAAEIQERILTTFHHTLDLAARGERREAAVGCSFILQLDPTFEPASRLKERLDEGEGPVEVEDLRAAAPAPAPAESGGPGSEEKPPSTPPSDPPAASGAGEIFELPTLDPEPPPAAGTPAPPTDTTSVAGPASGGGSDADLLDLEAALDLSALGSSEADAPAEPPTVEAPALEEPPALESPTSSEPGAAAGTAQPPVTEPPAIDSPVTENPANEPIAALDNESEQRVDELLNEGQGAFENQQYQSAIDAWSRIFLIDIDHQEASRRIELARKLKAEVERQVDELFHQGVSQVESGSFDEARATFTKVIEMQGTHLAAQEYLDKLEAGTLEESEGPAPVPPPPPAKPAEPATPPTDDALSLPDSLGEPLSELDALPGDALEMPGELEVPTDLDEEPAERPRRGPRPKPPPVVAKPSGIKKPFLYIGGAVLALVAVGGWFLLRDFDDTFPNAGQPAPTVARPQVDVIARAQQVFTEGNVELAIAQLKRLPPNHPRYAEAQALIAKWETPEGEGDAAEQLASEEQIAERNLLVAEAREAFEGREFLRAHRLLTQAAAVTALDDEAVQLQTAAALELQPLRSEIEIFRQGEWAEALRSLWQIRQSDPSNPDVLQLMVDSYYNLGVRDLQRRDPDSAAENLQEAIDLVGDDPELARLLKFARTYQNRPVDLLYRIFVKYLPFR